MEPRSEEGHRRWQARGGGRGLSPTGLARGIVLVALALATVTMGRAAYESRARLRLGEAAERAGDLATARLRYGEARLWRAPLFPWAARAEARLGALPAGPDAALAGALAGAPAPTSFGRVPRPWLAAIGGLALVAAFGAAAGWAVTARRLFGVLTALGGVLAALALGAA